MRHLSERGKNTTEASPFVVRLICYRYIVSDVAQRNYPLSTDKNIVQKGVNSDPPILVVSGLEQGTYNECRTVIVQTLEFAADTCLR